MDIVDLADRDRFDGELYEAQITDDEAAELRAVLGFPPPVSPPSFRLGHPDALESGSSSSRPPPTAPAAEDRDPSAGPHVELEALIRALAEQLSSVSERLARLEARYSDPSALLEEVDRKLEKLLDPGRRVERAADGARSSVRDVQLDDLRLQIHDLRVGIERMTKMLFG